MEAAGADTHSGVTSGVERGTRSGIGWRWSAIALLWAYALAIILTGSLPRLPDFTALIWLAVVPSGIALLPARVRLLRLLLPLLLAALLGAGWSLWHNQRALAQRLPLSAHGADFLLEVELVSLPGVRLVPSRFGDSSAQARVRFSVRVIRALALPEALPPSHAELQGRLLDLTWYRIDERTLQQLRAGSVWRLPVRLKRPRGSVNPHGFDYEGWLLQRGVYATGYVRPRDHPPQHLGDSPGLASLRHELRDRLLGAASHRGGLLVALLLGDRSRVSNDERRLLRETGTAHLLSISGLHVGLVAGFFLMLGNALRRLVGLASGRAHLLLASLLGLAASLVYTLLAGAPLSATRSLVMTWVMLLAWQWRRRVGAGLAFSLALALVLTLQPLAFFGAGFCLSFIAVAALLLGFSGRVKRAGSDAETGSWQRRIWDNAQGMLHSQWLVAIGLLLPSLMFFSGFSPSGMLLNLVAIPWLGFLILPPLLIGTPLIGTAIGDGIVGFADWQLDLMMRFLALGREVLPAWLNLGAPAAVPLLVLSALGALLLLLPAGLPGRRLGWLFLLPPLLPWISGAVPQVRAYGAEEGLRVTVLDVGQGLAVAVRLAGHSLVYDAGPMSGSGWSAGSQIVAPYLLGEGVATLDRVVISHGDRDHAGGFAGLAQSMPIEQVWAPGRLADKLHHQGGLPVRHCVAGEEEHIGELRLQWLWPGSEAITGEENDHSCVALLEWRGVRILLAGDISSKVERQLSRSYPALAPVDLLLAPHHGSATSSSRALIDWARPRRVVFSAGYRHYFGHPAPEVVARYAASGARLFNTAESGALEFTWHQPGRAPRVESARSAPRFWYADHTDETDAAWRLSRRGELW